MILLRQNVQDYNNDLRAMIMAFYPGEKIEDYEKHIKRVFDNQCDEDEDKVRFLLSASFKENEITELSVGLINDESAGEKRCIVKGDFKDRKVFRNHLKLAVYRLLCDFTGRKLPWGDLTGVRPTKIAMKKIREGKSREEVVDYYKATYDTDGSKAKLSFDVADKELEIIKDIDLKNSY